MTDEDRRRVAEATVLLAHWLEEEKKRKRVNIIALVAFVVAAGAVIWFFGRIA